MIPDISYDIVKKLVHLRKHGDYSSILWFTTITQVKKGLLAGTGLYYTNGSPSNKDVEDIVKLIDYYESLKLSNSYETLVVFYMNYLISDKKVIQRIILYTERYLNKKNSLHKSIGDIFITATQYNFKDRLMKSLLRNCIDKKMTCSEYLNMLKVELKN